MGECARCHVDGYRNNEVRMYFSGCCDCCLCSRCLPWAKAGVACPGCGTRIRAEDFSCDSRASREVDREMKVRRQIKQVYCKTERDFASSEKWDEYLMLREDIIYTLAYSSSKEEVQETWRQVERYKAHHSHDIRQRQQELPRKALEKMAAVITAEGDFSSRVNAEWATAAQFQHPLQEQYNNLLKELPESPVQGVQTSPVAPQPLLSAGGTSNQAVQSGGGQETSIGLKKARYFFLADLDMVYAGRRPVRASIAVEAGWHPGAEDADEAAPLPDESNENDESSSYNDLGVHREMLEDRVRTEAFREAIFQTCQERVVLEVGCGSGILSVFAAQAGARRVVAVEADVEMAELAQEEVAQVVDQALDGQKVDVLISEWMGFMLVCEDMFRSVVFARDRWLAEGGQMLPRRCQLFAAPFSHMELVERQTGFWGSKPYGVDLSVLAFPALDQHLCRPVIGSLTQQQLLSDGDLLFELDCQKAARDAVRQRDCHFTAVVQHQGHFHGIAVWFDCELLAGLHFTTGPQGDPTHWEQTLLFLDPASELMDMNLQQGDEIAGELRWLVRGKDLGVVILGEVSKKSKTYADDQTDFKALELELVDGIRTTQAAQVKLQQERCSRHVSAGGEVLGGKAAVFLQQKRPSKAMKAFSDVMEFTKAAALTSEDEKKYPSLLEQLEQSAEGEVRFVKPRDRRLPHPNPPRSSTEEAQSKQVAINGQSTNKYSRPDDGGDDQSETKTNANSPAGRRPSVRSTNQTSPREYHEVYENGVEHLAWLNQSLKHLWPEMSEAARAIAHSKVLPVIKSKLIAKGKGAITDVKFDQFTLGSQPVVLGPIQVSRMPRGSDYRSDMHVGLDLDTSYGNWRFGMKDFRIVGEMVLRVRPHIPDSPGTGGVSIFFVDPPKVDFTFSGNMSFGNFPFIKEAIRHACDSIIADMFVLPNVASQHMSLTDLKMYPLVFSSPVPHAKKPTAGIFRRMASGVGKVLKGVAYAWEETEEFLERQVGSVIGVTTEPYMKWQLGQQVWMPDFKPGASFNFAMYDPEQHLQVSLWDRDLLCLPGGLAGSVDVYAWPAGGVSSCILFAFSSWFLS
eukprot:g25663.t2